MDFRRGVSPALTPGLLSFTLDDYRLSGQTLGRSIGPGLDDEPLSPLRPSPAATLPTEVILQIFLFTDPETFASLVLVNRTWRQAAEHYQAYAYQLARCPSYAGRESEDQAPFQEKDIGKLRRRLGLEAKRNLFAAFLRPRQTIINLVSNNASPASAFPRGEAFEFTFSQRAQFALATNSSRIIVIDCAAVTPRVVRELKVVRRPISVCILADGSLLAVLAANHRVNIYDLARKHVMFRQSLELAETAHTITMTTGGEILAAGCEGGVEVVSLRDSGAQPAKRVIKCDRVDHLAFSTDGTMLLGTTQAARAPSTVILTAPYFSLFSEQSMDRAEMLSHLWTSQIIFPNSSRDCSHAALLPRSQDNDANWTLAYDRVFESFRAVRTDDLRNGTTYFTGPDPERSSMDEIERQQRQWEEERIRLPKTSFTPRTLPAITTEGELVAAAFLTSDIWLYGVPEDLEHSNLNHSTTPLLGLPSHVTNQRGLMRELDRLPRWQLLVDRYRNVFAKGRKVASVTGASNVCWCTPDPCSDPSPQGYDRLVVAAPGGVSDSSDFVDTDLVSVDGGRLVFLDFHLGSVGGETKELIIEVGSSEPELLEEENMDLEDEIAVVRRRTLARQEGVSRLHVSSVAGVLRPMTIAGTASVSSGSATVAIGLERSDSYEESGLSPDQSHASESIGNDVDIEGLEEPYSPSGPRTRGVVYRSAAAVEANRRRNPPIRPGERAGELRRTDGTEVPHESDADNWVPPPPAYGDHVGDDELARGARRRSGSFQDGGGLAVLRDPDSARSAPRTSRQQAASQLSPLAIRSSLVDQLSPGISTATRSLAPPMSPHGPLVSPLSMSMQSPTSIPRRRLASNETSYADPGSRRRSIANIEGTRWFSRHQENRSSSPALSDHNDLPRRSQSQRDSRVASPPHARRPMSSYTPRSPLYRAALRPASVIDTIHEPDTSRTSSVVVTRGSLAEPSTRPVSHIRLASYPPSSSDTTQLAAFARQDRSISPVRGDFYGTPRRGVWPQPHPRAVSPSEVERPPTTFYQSEQSAWTSNTERIALEPRRYSTPSPEPSHQPAHKSQRLLGLGRFGHSPSGAAPPSITIDSESPPRTHTRNTSSSSRPNLQRSKSASKFLRNRSFRFLRNRQTGDPDELAAGAPSAGAAAYPSTITARDMMDSFHAAAAGPSHMMAGGGHAHSQSLMAPTAPAHGQDWDSAAQDEMAVVARAHQRSVSAGDTRARESRRRSRFFARVPPSLVPPGFAPEAVREALLQERISRETKCMIM